MKTRNVVLLGCAGLFAAVVGVFLFLGMIASFFNDDDLSFGDGVGVVNLIGTINDSRDVVEELERNGDDPSVKAVVLRIDSPGGGVAPSQEIHDAVLRLRETKPVVTSIGNIAASGGYYVAVATDSIVANPGSLAGSIGVIFSYVTADELMQKIGVNLQVFKSGPIKDVGSFHREPTPAERALLGGIVGDTYEQFVDAVAEGRRMPREKVLELADGSIFTGRQAVRNHLVDALGGFREAVLMAASLGGLEGEPKLISKERRRFRFSDLMRDAASGAASRVISDATAPRLEYRFR